MSSLRFTMARRLDPECLLVSQSTLALHPETYSPAGFSIAAEPIIPRDCLRRPVNSDVGRRKMRPEIALTFAPVSWPAALVCNGEHRYGIASNLVKDRVGEVTKNMSPKRILVFGPHQRTGTKLINCFKCLGSKSVGRNRAALEVPKECLPYFCLGLGQNLDFKAGHRALSRALASTQETALTVPARSAAWRALISCRQASVIAESSLPSRLSSSATVKAERSSAGKPRASSKMWSTWAFMQQSLALKFSLVTACLEPPPNPAVEIAHKAARGRSPLRSAPYQSPAPRGALHGPL
jgi:hypothetical protein